MSRGLGDVYKRQNMPVSNLPVPEEGKRIDQSYPKFSGWISSNGKQNKDWYK